MTDASKQPIHYNMCPKGRITQPTFGVIGYVRNYPPRFEEFSLVAQAEIAAPGSRHIYVGALSPTVVAK